MKKGKEKIIETKRTKLKGSQTHNSFEEDDDPITYINYENEIIELRVPLGGLPFDAKGFGNTVLKEVSAMSPDNSQTCDVAILIGEERILSHRLILTIWSQTFYDLLHNYPNPVSPKKKEQVEDESKPIEIKIDIPKEDYDYFRYMIKYMYSGELDFINGNNVLPILSLAHFFGIHSLKEECGRRLSQILVPEDQTTESQPPLAASIVATTTTTTTAAPVTVAATAASKAVTNTPETIEKKKQKISEDLLFLVDIAEKYDVDSLASACGEHLALKFCDLWEEGRLDDLSINMWSKILRSDNLIGINEDELFDLVLDLIETRFSGDVSGSSTSTLENSSKKKKQIDSQNQKQDALMQLLPCIRFPTISAKNLVERIESDPFLEDFPLIHDFIYEAFKYQLNPTSYKLQAQSTNRRTKNKTYPKIRLPPNMSHTLWSADCLLRLQPRNGFSYDRQKCSSSITISSDHTASFFGSGWHNVCLTPKMTRLLDYIEWSVSGSNIMVGISHGYPPNTNGYSGQWASGWSYYSSGQLYHSGSITTTGQTFSTAGRDVVGFKIFWDSGAVQFYVDGIPTVRGTSVPMPTTNDRGEEVLPDIYPVVCFCANGAKATLRTTKAPGSTSSVRDGERWKKRGKNLGEPWKTKQILKNDPTAITGLRQYLKY